VLSVNGFVYHLPIIGTPKSSKYGDHLEIAAKMRRQIEDGLSHGVVIGAVSGRSASVALL
jgi:hypothetical protein